MSEPKSGSRTPKRSDVIAMDTHRHQARAQLRGDSAIAKQELSPRHLLRRWKNRQQRRVEAFVTQGKAAARKNAPLIGTAAAAAVIFAARKPIIRVLRDYRGSRHEN